MEKHGQYARTDGKQRLWSPQKESKEILEIKTTGTDMSSVFDGLTSSPYTAGIRITEPEDVSTEIFQTEMRSVEMKNIQELEEITKGLCKCYGNTREKE